MSLTLRHHPLWSCCQKLLIARYELGLDFEPRLQAYFERRLQQPSVARVLAGAGRYFRDDPLRDALPTDYRPA